MFGRLNGLVFSIFLFVSSLLGAIFIIFPFVPFAYFTPRLWRFLSDRFIGYWLIFPSSMMFFLFGVKFHVTGDVIDRTKPSLIIMNHRTRLDWLFFWNVLYKMDPWLLTTEKISLKASLKRIPGAGWAMGSGAYIFMSRVYKQDQRVLKVFLKYYKDSGVNYQLLLFPEGTDRGMKSVQLSNDFADKHGLPHYDYLLHPRTAGFNYILNNMQELGYIDKIYDVTVGYPDRIIKSEIDFLRKGDLPNSVHFDVKQYNFNDILPTQVTDQTNELSEIKMDYSNWLNALWKDKEERLRQFYNESDQNKRAFVPSGDGYQWPIETKGIAYYIAFFFWLFFSIFWIYFLVMNCLVQIYALLAVSFYIWADYCHGGIELLVFNWFYNRNLFLDKKL